MLPSRGWPPTNSSHFLPSPSGIVTDQRSMRKNSKNVTNISNHVLHAACNTLGWLTDSSFRILRSYYVMHKGNIYDHMASSHLLTCTKFQTHVFQNLIIFIYQVVYQ
jgi:hypothetical protein